MVKIAPSILSADFSRLGEQVSIVEQAGAEILHIDIMDGHFVPNLTFGPGLVSSIRPHSKLSFDVHLMIEKPEQYIKDFASAGANHITVHAEATSHLHRVVQQIKDLGLTAGVALNPASSLDSVKYLLEDLDMVLIMTVNPGFGGQKFIPACLAKIEELRARILKSGTNCEIEVDGGINSGTALEVARAGATILVAGAAVFAQPDPALAFRQLHEAVNK
ncbi:MAG: ribulose-phosphate 3-epimerase [Desulfitobacterium hafniense]|nr:ribulose-phosphate 3-epimerase [Desulfitobacterium hafniense]